LFKKKKKKKKKNQICFKKNQTSAFLKYEFVVLDLVFSNLLCWSGDGGASNLFLNFSER